MGANHQHLPFQSSHTGRAFDRLARLTAKMMHTPVALVLLGEGDNQLLKSCVGLRTQQASRSEVRLAQLCSQHIIATEKPLSTRDIRKHPILQDSLAIRDPGFVAYAGVPLRTSTGRAIGSLCAIDTVSRSWSEDDIVTLQDLAALVMTDVELRDEISSLPHQAEAILRENEEYRLITENTNDLISLIDDQGQYCYVSPSYRAILGYDPAALIGVPGFELVHPDDLGAVLETWTTVSHQDGAQVTFRYRHADGTWRWTEARGKLVERQGRHYVVAIGRDITERRRLEAQLLQSQKMESIGQLAGGIAHDFNNLLMAISGYTSLVLNRLPDDLPIRSDLEEVQLAARRAADLTRQLLAFARKQIIQPRIIDLNQLVLDVEKLLRRLVSEDIELVTSLTLQLNCIQVDPSQIEQVLVNLAVNARDAMPNGGKLTIETANVIVEEAYAQQYAGMVPGDYVLLTVSDSGTGMDAVVQSHLFEPFFTTKEPGRGTGLGLATCYGIVKQHRGYIWIGSSVGHGTTIKVYLPRVEGAADVLLRQDKTEQTLRGSETILLVEDEVTVRGVIKRVLRAQGYTVLEATNGAEALEVVKEQGTGPIDLIVTDLIMPHMGGKSLAEQLKAIHPTMKLLFVSGYTHTSLVHDGWLRHDVNFLQKPFTPMVLARKVREVIDSW